MFDETAGLALGYIQPEGVQCLIDCLDSKESEVRLTALMGFYGHTNLLNQKHVQLAITELAERETVQDIKPLLLDYWLKLLKFIKNKADPAMSTFNGK